MTDLPRRAVLTPTMSLIIALAVFSLIGFLVLYFRIDGIQSQVVAQGDRNFTKIGEIVAKADALVAAQNDRAVEAQNLKTQMDGVNAELARLREVLQIPAAATTTTTTTQ